MVGMRGSSQPLTKPELTSLSSLRLLSCVYSMFSRDISYTFGRYSPSASRSQ